MKKLTLILASIFLLQGCSYVLCWPPPRYPSQPCDRQYSIGVYPKGLRDEVLSMVMPVMEAYDFYNVHRVVIEVRLEDDFFDCGVSSPTGKCYGLYAPPGKIVVGGNMAALRVEFERLLRDKMGEHDWNCTDYFSPKATSCFSEYKFFEQII